MTRVAILGAGAGGLSSAVELGRAGHEVRLWSRNEATIRPYEERGAVPYRGVLGEGSEKLSTVTSCLDEALASVDVVIVCLPALAHEAVFAYLARSGCSVPVVLNPGHTGGALHARAVFRAQGAAAPPVAELSTLTYVARVGLDAAVHITCRAAHVRCGALPGGEAAIDAAQELFSCATRADDVLASSLANVNLVLHPPGAILAAAWVEAPGHEFTFYVEGLTPGVARVRAARDEERLAVARCLGHELPPLVEEMALIGTVDEEQVRSGSAREAIRAGSANREIAAPRSLRHRYYAEALPFGLGSFLALSRIAGVPVRTADALFALGGTLLGRDLRRDGLGARELGIEGLDGAGLLELVGRKR